MSEVQIKKVNVDTFSFSESTLVKLFNGHAGNDDLNLFDNLTSGFSLSVVIATSFVARVELYANERMEINYYGPPRTPPQSQFISFFTTLHEHKVRAKLRHLSTVSKKKLFRNVNSCWNSFCRMTAFFVDPDMLWNIQSNCETEFTMFVDLSGFLDERNLLDQ